LILIAFTYGTKCVYVDMYIHISYFICGKLTFDYTKWPQYEADQLLSSGAKAMNG